MAFLDEKGLEKLCSNINDSFIYLKNDSSNRIILKTLNNFNRIKLIGDSITWGGNGDGYHNDPGDPFMTFTSETSENEWYTNSKGYCWANLLRDKVLSTNNIELINYGCAGITTYKASLICDRLITEEDNGGIILIMLGSNDRTQTSEAGFRQALLTLCLRAKEVGSLPILMSPPPAIEDDKVQLRYSISKVREVYMEIAKENNILFFDLYHDILNFCIKSGLDISNILDDRVHPNNLGHEIIFNLICERLGFSLPNNCLPNIRRVGSIATSNAYIEEDITSDPSYNFNWADGYIRSNNALTPSTNYQYNTNPITLESGDEIIVKTIGYNDMISIISSTTGEGEEKQITSLVPSVANDNYLYSYSFVAIEKTDIILSVRKDNYKIYLRNKSVKEEIESLHIASSPISLTNNLFDKDSLLISKSYNPTTGELIESHGHSSTPLIPFKSNLPRMKATQPAYCILTFDSEKNIISATDVPDTYYSFNMDGASYVAFVFANNITNYDTLMICYVNETSGGTQNTIGNLPYEPYLKYNNEIPVTKVLNNIQTKLTNFPDWHIADYDKMCDLASNMSGCAIEVANNKKILTAENNTDSTVYMFTDTVPCKSYEVIVCEFRGMSSKPDGETENATGGLIIPRFLNSDTNEIAGKYNFDILGVTTHGYHRYAIVAPSGTKYFKWSLALRANTTVSFSDFRIYKQPQLSQRQQNGILYDAHLGGNIVCFPENTMPAFEAAKSAGFSSIITNMNITSDGIIVCLHDDTIDRTSDGTGNVSDYTYEQLLQYDFGSWLSKHFSGTKIPKLEEFIRFCAVSGIKPIIRMSSKFDTTNYDNLIPVIYSWICKYGLRGNAGIKAFSTTIIDKCANIMGKDVEYILATNISDDFITYCKNFDGDITLESAYSNDELQNKVPTALTENIKLSMYTVNQPSQMRKAILAGVTRFATDAGADMVFPIEDSIS